MLKKFILFFSLVSAIIAADYRAYDIGGDTLGSTVTINIKGEEYTLLPFSYLDIKKENVNLDGDFTLLIGTVNGKKIEPIKIASNYKFDTIVVKVFKSKTDFDDNTFVMQTKELFIDKDAIRFSLDINEED